MSNRDAKKQGGRMVPPLSVDSAWAYFREQTWRHNKQAAAITVDRSGLVRRWETARLRINNRGQWVRAYRVVARPGELGTPLGTFRHLVGGAPEDLGRTPEDCIWLREREFIAGCLIDRCIEESAFHSDEELNAVSFEAHPARCE